MLGIFILPIVMVLGAFHFLLLFIVRGLGLKRAELSTWRHLLALDQYANTLLGGDHRETISSRLGRSPDCKFCTFVCRLLDFFDPNHCEDAAKAFLSSLHRPQNDRNN